MKIPSPGYIAVGLLIYLAVSTILALLSSVGKNREILQKEANGLLGFRMIVICLALVPGLLVTFLFTFVVSPPTEPLDD